MNVASPRSVTRRKRHVAHNLDRFGPRGEKYPTSCMLRSSGLIGCVYKMMRMREKGPCLALYSQGGRVTSRFEKRLLVGYG
jgi:hypothetical protein